jgi:hypothetical protein
MKSEANVEFAPRGLSGSNERKFISVLQKLPINSAHQSALILLILVEQLLEKGSTCTHRYRTSAHTRTRVGRASKISTPEYRSPLYVRFRRGWSSARRSIRIIWSIRTKAVPERHSSSKAQAHSNPTILTGIAPGRIRGRSSHRHFGAGAAIRDQHRELRYAITSAISDP